MTVSMRFSVITVTRNSEAVLPRAMASLAQQTFADYEWIVVDGASEDGTVAIAKPFDAAPLQLVSERDGGIYDAMNKGIRLARGDYLYFLNSDDRLASATVLERASQAIREAGEPDLLVGQVRSVGPATIVLRDYSHITPQNLLFSSLCHQAAFVHRNLFARHGIFDTVYTLAADFDWFARVFRGGARVVFAPLVIANFSANGAHVRAAEVTRSETLRIRRAHARLLERVLAHGLAWVKHKARRLVGLPARGRLARIEDPEFIDSELRNESARR